MSACGIRSEYVEADLGERLHFRIIILKETEVLVRNVHIGIPTVGLVFFSRSTTARECVRFDLFRDGLGVVGHEDCRVDVGCRHFRVGTLEGWEEFGVEKSGLLVAESVGCVSSKEELDVSEI